MFNHLIASEPGPAWSLTSRTVIASVGVHVLLVGGALYASVHVPSPEAAEPEEMVTYVEIESAPELPEPVAAPPAPREAPESAGPAPTETPGQEALVEEAEPEEVAPPVARGFQDIVPPEAVSDRLPDVDLSARAVTPADFSGVGVSGGIARGFVGGERRNTVEEPPTGGEAVDVAVVEERPTLANAAEMQRVLRRLYPSLLRENGVMGETVLKFVIDTDGRVELETVEVLSTTHEGFAEASTRMVERFRFRPARIEGRKVRVAISMPIQWRLENM